MSTAEKRPAPAPPNEAERLKTSSGGTNKTRRVQNNVRAFSSTQNDRHPFIEAYYTYAKVDRNEQTTDTLMSLFLSGSAESGDPMPITYTDQMMGSIHELMQKLMSTPSVCGDANLVPNVMFHTVDPDILSAMVLRELKVAMVQAQNQQMDTTDNIAIAYTKHLGTTEFNVKAFLARGGLSETHPTVTERALAATDMLREAYDKPAYDLPAIITTAVNSIRNRPTLQQALRLPPPEPRNLFRLTLPAFERYLLLYDHAKMHDTYRPCCMRDACCFIRADKSALIPVRNAPLVAWWRPGCRTFIDATLPPFCIMCYTLYINILSLVGRLRAQDGFFAQVFEVEVGGLNGFPADYVYMPAMVQRQSRHNGYIGPFPNLSRILENLVRAPGGVSIKIPPIAPPKGDEPDGSSLKVAVPNFS